MWNIKKIIKKGDYLYALVPEHPNCTKKGYVLMHRIVMENHLKRVLNENEVVHHKDGNKHNNVITNLEVFEKGLHSKYHGKQKGRLMTKLKCPWCGKIFTIFKNKSFLNKTNKYGCTCCSPSCRGQMYRQIQLHGLTPKLKSAISGNLLAEYRHYVDEDNSEETS